MTIGYADLLVQGPRLPDDLRDYAEILTSTQDAAAMIPTATTTAIPAPQVIGVLRLGSRRVTVGSSSGRCAARRVPYVKL